MKPSRRRELRTKDERRKRNAAALRNPKYESPKKHESKGKKKKK